MPTKLYVFNVYLNGNDASYTYTVDYFEALTDFHLMIFCTWMHIQGYNSNVNDVTIPILSRPLRIKSRARE